MESADQDLPLPPPEHAQGEDEAQTSLGPEYTGPRVLVWDPELGRQLERKATPEEVAEMDARAVIDINALKAAKNAEINAARLAANQGTFIHQDKPVACDPLSRSDIDGVNGFVALTGSLPPGWPGAWKAADNSLLLIPDVSAWTAFYGAMVAAGNANFGKAQQLKAALEAASTVAEVAAVVW